MADGRLTRQCPAGALEKYSADAPPELKQFYEDKIKFNQVCVQ